jgi:hypothetical protein
MKGTGERSCKTRRWRGCSAAPLIRIKPPPDPKRDSTKKGAAVAGGSKVNREASNRVDRSHSMSRRWTLAVMLGKA